MSTFSEFDSDVVLLSAQSRFVKYDMVNNMVFNTIELMSKDMNSHQRVVELVNLMCMYYDEGYEYYNNLGLGE